MLCVFETDVAEAFVIEPIGVGMFLGGLVGIGAYLNGPIVVWIFTG